MRINLPVTGWEVNFAGEIISATDLKGRITYVNQEFVKTSGFAKDELLNQPHNLIRHPDMPPEAFKSLWDTIKAGKSWMGVVKNRCKNGDHYWVDAFVTPVFQNGQVSGYESVRVPPKAEWKQRAEELYRLLRSGKKFNPHRKLGLGAKLGLSFTVLLVLPKVVGTLLGTPVGFWVGLVLAVLAGWGISYAVTSKLKGVVSKSQRLIDDPVARLVYSGRDDEAGQLETALLFLQAQSRTMRGRFEEVAAQVAEIAAQNGAAAQNTGQILEEQRQATVFLAQAIEEMHQTIHSIAKNAACAASTASRTRTQVEEGVKISRQIAAGIAALANEAEKAADVVRKVEQESKAIGVVVSVIREIADQTNLLALNAAIEAARAGDQGRGFAVVAEEVRRLAASTQDSTHQIERLIGRLQQIAQESVQVIANSCQFAQHNAAQAEAAASDLSQLIQDITAIQNMSLEVASAVEQQALMSDAIKRKANEISAAVDRIAADAQATASLSDGLTKLAAALCDLVKRFKG